MKDKVSVVIPCYNRMKTIERCLLSVLNQTVQPYEILVVDDGSTDGTLDIVKKIDSDKIRTLKQNHRGAQAARNLGILNAKGDYIAFLDSDDEWEKDTLGVLGEYLKNHNNSTAFYCNCLRFEEENSKKQILRMPNTRGKSERLSLKKSFALFGCMFVPRKKLLEIGLLDENVSAYQEWDTTIRLAEVCEFVHIDKTLMIYHIHSDSAISKNHESSVKGYSYIVKKNKNRIINAWGYEELMNHYKYIMSVCLQMKELKKYLYYLKYFFLYESCLIKSNAKCSKR